MQQNENTYDVSDVYKKEIFPKIIELKMICMEQKIPMIFCAAVGESGTVTNSETEMISAETAGRTLSDDPIAKMVMGVLGTNRNE